VAEDGRDQLNELNSGHDGGQLGVSGGASLNNEPTAWAGSVPGDLNIERDKVN